MKPLTLKKCKDQVAKTRNCTDWNHFIIKVCFPLGDVSAPELVTDEVAKLFGDSQWNAALEKAIKISENRQDECTDNAEYLGHLKVIEELKRLKR